MKIFTVDNSIVNVNFPLLSNNNPHGLCLRTNSTTTYAVSNDDFGAWWIASRVENLYCTPEALSWYQPRDPFALSFPEGLLYPPRDYHRIAYGRMRIGSAALWMDMGLGKTYVSLAFALKLFLARGTPYFLIVCPLSVFVTWMDEVIKFISPDLRPAVVIAHGTKRKKLLAALQAAQDNRPTFIVTTYETLGSISDILVSMGAHIGSIFFDEASLAKNFDAARSQHCHKLVNRLGDTPRYLLSGTPSTANILGYYSLYELLYPGASNCENAYHFKARYLNEKKFLIVEQPVEGGFRPTHVYADGAEKWLQRNNPPGVSKTYWDDGWGFSYTPVQPDDKKIHILRSYAKADGVKNQEMFQCLTAQLSYTLKKEKVLKQLPPKSYVRRSVKMAPEQKKAYAEILASSRTEIGEQRFSFRNLSSPYAKLHQIANGYLINSQGDVHFFEEQPKLDDLKLILEETGDEKIIVWAPFIPMLEMTGKFLTKENVKHAVISGATPPQARMDRVRSFRDNPEHRVLLLNPAVGGMGLNLTCAHIEVFETNWYKPDVRNQAEDRTWRDGQEYPVTIIDQLSEGTLEKKILNNLLAHIDTEDQLLSIQDLMPEGAF